MSNYGDEEWHLSVVDSEERATWAGTAWTLDGQQQEFTIDGKLTVDVESGFIEGKGSDESGSFTLRGFISVNL